MSPLNLRRRALAQLQQLEMSVHRGLQAQMYKRVAVIMTWELKTALTHNGDVIENSNESTESSEQATDNAPIHAEGGQPEAEHPASGQEDAASIQNELVVGNDSGNPGKETQTHKLILKGWKSISTIILPNHKGMLVSEANVKEPTTYKESDSLQPSIWKQAIKEEQLLHEYRTWTLETQPKGIVTIPCKWVSGIYTIGSNATWAT
jgi:hypothetical protein